MKTNQMVGKIKYGPKFKTPIGNAGVGGFADSTGRIGLEAEGSSGSATMKGSTYIDAQSITDFIGNIDAKINEAIKNNYAK
ncbi:hypothetical protein MEG05_01905 [Vibrio aestuarianus]|nr:hypothetical protein [Vibrio aestuarianus]MDE1313072.1 hypothetical protein [Vibrio aestuarianus]